MDCTPVLDPLPPLTIGEAGHEKLRLTVVEVRIVVRGAAGAVRSPQGGTCGSRGPGIRSPEAGTCSTRAMLPALRRHRSPRVVNVGSSSHLRAARAQAACLESTEPDRDLSACERRRPAAPFHAASHTALPPIPSKPPRSLTAPSLVTRRRSVEARPHAVLHASPRRPPVAHRRRRAPWPRLDPNAAAALGTARASLRALPPCESPLQVA